MSAGKQTPVNAGSSVTSQGAKEAAAGLTVVVLRARGAGLTSGSVEGGAARGCAAEDHGSHSHHGHIY